MKNICEKCRQFENSKNQPRSNTFEFTPHERYMESDTTYRFDIDYAYAALSHFSTPTEMIDDPKLLKDLLEQNVVNRDHLPHIDRYRASPGLIFSLKLTRSIDQQTEEVAFLADGNHRATLCLEEGSPFEFYFVSDENARYCLIDESRRSVDVSPPQELNAPTRKRSWRDFFNRLFGK